MAAKRKPGWLLLALVMGIALPAGALAAPFVMKSLFWRFGSDPAGAVLQGEHWGRVICAVLLTVSPFVPVACFLL